MSMTKTMRLLVRFCQWLPAGATTHQMVYQIACIENLQQNKYLIFFNLIAIIKNSNHEVSQTIERFFKNYL